MKSAFTFQNHTLAIERQVKRVLVNDCVDHYPVTSQAFLDDALRKRCTTDSAFFASLASSLFALGHLDKVFGRFDLEYFTGFVTDDLFLLTADPANALLGCAWDDLFDSLQMPGQLLTSGMLALFFSRCRNRFALSLRCDFSVLDSWLQFKEFELFETQTLAAWSVSLDQIQPAKVPQDPVLFLESCHLFFKLLVAL